MKMLLNYLFLACFANIPLVFGSQFLPPEPSPGTTCNCNCNMPKPTPYYDSFGQQTMVCIPVPITIQGMYSPTSEIPGYMRPLAQKHSKNMAAPEVLSDSSLPEGRGPVPGQQSPPGPAGNPAAPVFLEYTEEQSEKPDLFSGPYSGALQAEVPEGFTAEVPSMAGLYDSPVYRDMMHDYIID